VGSTEIELSGTSGWLRSVVLWRDVKGNTVCNCKIRNLYLKHYSDFCCQTVYCADYLNISSLLLSLCVCLVISVCSFTAVLLVTLAVWCASGVLSGTELGSCSRYLKHVVHLFITSVSPSKDSVHTNKCVCLFFSYLLLITILLLKGLRSMNVICSVLFI